MNTFDFGFDDSEDSPHEDPLEDLVCRLLLEKKKKQKKNNLKGLIYIYSIETETQLTLAYT